MSSSNYPLPPPSGDKETQRLEIQHELSLIDQDGSLLRCEFPPSPSTHQHEHHRQLRVADIGTGTGIWAIEFARQQPSVQVVGFDLGLPRHPPGASEDLPANVTFAVQDVAQPWPCHGPAAGPFDLIHGRQILINLPSPALALQRVWESLRPGGTVEFREFWHPLESELELSVREGAREEVPLLIEWHVGTVQAASAAGCDHTYASRLPDDLGSSGFVDIDVVDRKVPLGGWTLDGQVDQDDRTRKMDGLLCRMIRYGAPELTRNMFVKGLGWTEAQADEYAARVVNELARGDLGADRIYARFRVVTARRPG